MKKLIEFNRNFQIYSYSASHGALLLRSPKSDSRSTRVDVLFTDVRLIAMRAFLSKLLIEEGDISDVEEHDAKRFPNLEHGHKIFLITGGEWTGYIIGGSVQWHEDQGQYGQPSVFDCSKGVI